MKIDSQGILNINRRYFEIKSERPIEQLNIFIRTSIKKKWEQILHLTVHCVKTL